MKDLKIILCNELHRLSSWDITLTASCKKATQALAEALAAHFVPRPAAILASLHKRQALLQAHRPGLFVLILYSRAAKISNDSCTELQLCTAVTT